jgi:hypothetical protein
MHTSLEPGVEVALSATASQYLGLDNEGIFACKAELSIDATGDE